MPQDFFIPSWLVTVLALVVAVAGAWLMHWLLYRGAARLLSSRDEFWRVLLKRTRGPVRLGLLIVALSVASNAVQLSDREVGIMRHVLLVGFIVCIAWVARTALDIWMSIHLRRFRLDVEDNLLARKHVTQTRILQRVAAIVIVVVGLAAVLMTFEGVRQYGVSLLASAGAAGLVVGLALQPLLRNLFAGIQLALTQPIRIDDAVIVEGEWGTIEEINSTYVVVRIWDKRRLVVPLNYFIEQPFQNWTREEATLIGSVMVYLDYSVPVDAVRAEINSIVKASRHWDRDVVAVQVTDFHEFVMELRILASASTAGRAFDLRCEIREKLAAFLQQQYPQALPRLRTTVEPLDAMAAAGDSHADARPGPHPLHGRNGSA